MTAPGYAPPAPTGWWVKKPGLYGPVTAALKKATFAATGTSIFIMGGSITATKSKATFAGTGRMHPKGAITSAAKKATASLSGSAGAEHYTDSFNRTDAATLGANWTERVAKFKLASNQARLTTGATTPISSFVSTMATNNHKVTVVTGAGTLGDILYLFVRANNSNQIIAVATRSSGTWAIGTYTGAYSGAVAGYTQRSFAVGQSFIDGDTISLEANNTVYTLKNGSTTVTTWTDTGYTTYPYADASHHEIAIGYNSSGTVYGIDSFAADDI